MGDKNAKLAKTGFSMGEKPVNKGGRPGRPVGSKDSKPRKKKTVKKG